MRSSPILAAPARFEPLEPRRMLTCGCCGSGCACCGYSMSLLNAPLLVQSAQIPIAISFQPTSAAVPSGFVIDHGTSFITHGNGYTYGWNATNNSTRDRNAIADQSRDTLIHTQRGGNYSWEIALPNGSYNVELVAGDASFFDSNYAFAIEGQTFLTGTPWSSNRFVSQTGIVSINDGRLTITNAIGASNNKLALIRITPQSTGGGGAMNARINFQTADAFVPDGYLADFGSTFANRGNGFSYGWNAFNNEPRNRDSNNSPDQRFDTLAHLQRGGDFTWELAVPNGQYDVRLVAGDPDFIDSNYKIDIEGTRIIDAVPTWSNRFIDNTARINVTDGRLTLRAAAGAFNTKINFIEVNSVSSNPVDPQQPFGGAPINLPGRIEAENYDIGGAGIAFNDTTSGNAGGAYRSDDVDVGNGGTGRKVGWTRPGEWLEYTVRLNQTGWFDVSARIASGSGGGAFSLSFNGVPIASNINLPNTGGWNNWQNVNAGRFEMPAGTHVIRLSFDRSNGGDIGDVDYLEFTAVNHTQQPINWPVSSEWQQVANAPQARFEPYSFVHQDQLYILGGWDSGDFNGLARVDRFNPATQTWSRLPDAPIPETHAAVAVDEENGVVYFVGGHVGPWPSVAVNHVWKLDIASWSFSRMPDLPRVQAAGGAGIVDNKLYFFGGVEERRDVNIPDHWMLDLANPSAGWSSRAPMPSARDHFSVAVVDGKIYAIGGEFGHDLLHDQQKLVHRYDPATNTWQRMADAPTAKSHTESGTFVDGNYIYFVGGQVFPQAATNEVARYDVRNNTWQVLDALPVHRQGAVIRLVGDYLVMTTGGVLTYQPQTTTWIYKVR